MPSSGSIVALLKKIMMHNQIFPDTAYCFYGFAGFDGNQITYPVSSLSQKIFVSLQPNRQKLINLNRL
jgi:hypothetical protein